MPDPSGPTGAWSNLHPHCFPSTSHSRPKSLTQPQSWQALMKRHKCKVLSFSLGAMGAPTPNLRCIKLAHATIVSGSLRCSSLMRRGSFPWGRSRCHLSGGAAHIIEHVDAGPNSACCGATRRSAWCVSTGTRKVNHEWSAAQMFNVKR